MLTQDEMNLITQARIEERKRIGEWLKRQPCTQKNYHEARITETWRVVNAWHLRALLDGKDPTETKPWHWAEPAHPIPDGYHM